MICVTHNGDVSPHSHSYSLSIFKHKFYKVCVLMFVVCLNLLQVIPAANDKVTRQIQSKLGDYNAVQQILEDDSKRLIGIDGVPASPAPVGSHGFFPAAAASRLQPKPEFKKPSTHQHGSAGTNARGNNHYYPHSAPRGGFLKPADSKPPHGGRGGYPGQPVKHGGGSNDHRSNGGIVPPKGPPQGGGGSGNSRVQQVARTLPRLNVNQVSIHEMDSQCKKPFHVTCNYMLVIDSPFFPRPSKLIPGRHL